MMYKYYLYAVSFAVMTSSCAATMDVEVSDTAPIVITDQGMKLVDRLLSKVPAYGVRMNIACAAAGTVLEEVKKWYDDHTDQMLRDGATIILSEQDEAFIVKSLEKILHPVKEFLETLRSQKTILEPIAVQSLGVDRARELMAFFEAQGDVESALKGSVTSIAKLEALARDVRKLFGDISASLSDDAKNRIKELQEKLRNKK